jgi:bacillithiol biosynthesis cysteine-adding enzyme BshC
MPNQPHRAPTVTPNLQSEFLSFREVPDTTRLFLDFLYQLDRVKSLFAPVKPRLEAVVDFAPVIREQPYPRDLLVEVLLEQNREFGSSPETLAHIERLRDPATVAVVTGQQAGLFTGPMYTILKALTAVKVSRDLQTRGISAVPVFWIECEDHDQDEVNHTCLVDRDGEWTSVLYSIDPSEAGQSIANVALTDAINDTINELINTLPPSEFIPDLERQIHNAYAPGISLAVGFARLLAQWFEGFELILLDPTDARLKRALTGLFEKVIRRAPELADRLLDHTRRLTDAGYHAQLHITGETVPLFIERDGKRTALVREGAQFALRAGDEVMSMEELLDVARTHPERLSPSVVLRPLVQDTLLPTLAYVGGPSEIAYLGQLRPLADWAGRAPTPVLPRASATLIERRYAKVLTKYNLQLPDLFGGLDQLLRAMAEQNLNRQTGRLFDETKGLFEEQLGKLRQALVGADPTLADAVETAQEKILYQLNHLRTRSTEVQAGKDEVVHRQLQRAFNVLYPDGGLQERQLNILHFLSRYGTGLLHQLVDTLDVWRPDHQIILVG